MMSHGSPTAAYDAATAYLAAGLSFIPIAADGSKAPAWRALPFLWSDSDHRNKHSWKPLQSRLPTPDEVREWFLDAPWGTNYGIAIIGGVVSGGLEIVDLDNAALIEPWATYVESHSSGLLDKLVFVQSPRPGLHVYYRSAYCGPSQKLARQLVVDPETNNFRPKTLIELKGEAGYVLAPGSPASCHPTGRSYEYASEKTLTEIPTISEAERNVLLAAARSLNTLDPLAPKSIARHPVRVGGSGGRPGDLYNAHATWAEILTPHGWECVGVDFDGTEHWRRPGKTTGQSASTNFQGTDLLYVFSENADPFEGGKSYCKFTAYALLEHGNDFQAAADKLAASDYGKVLLPRQRRRRIGS